MKRVLAHLARTLALVLWLAVPVQAQQASYVMPSTGPMSMGSFVATYLNPGLAALAGCSLGTTAPANGPGNAPGSGQCWWDTSSTPWVLKYWDTAAWVASLSLDPSTHAVSIASSETLSAQAGTSYTIVDANRGQLMTQSNAGASAWTLPAASTSNFSSGWWSDADNLGAGTLTITPTTSTINGASSLTLKQGRGARIVSDGTNYQAFGFAPLADTGSGAMVLQTGASLVAVNLGTPASGVATNLTGLPISTGVSGLGTGVATALAVNVGTAGAPVVNGGALGTPASGVATNLTGLPVSTGVSGLGTGVATALAVNVGTAGAPVVNGGALGTPASGVATNLTGLPVSTGVSGLGTGVATALATPSSANLRAALTDETGTGLAYFQNGALGTPASGVATNLTGLPVSTGVSGLGTGVATALAVNVGTAGAPVVNGGALGTPASGVATNLTGLPVSTGVSGLGTGVATALAVNVGTAGAPVVNGGALGTPASGVATNLTGLPVSTGVSGLGTGVATALATPSSANLRAALTDGTGTGLAYFQNGALGTPASGVATNLTGLPVSTGVSGLGTGVATALAVNVGTAGAPVVNGGALGTPASGVATNLTGLPISTGVSGLGTGVATALAVNVGTAGAPVVNGGALGTPASGVATNLTGLPVSTGVSGLGTGVATALAVNVGTAGAPVVNGGALGTPASGVATNLTGLPVSTGVSGLGTGVATALATPSSANLRAALTDGTGTGLAYFQNGALGTPASGVATNLTGLPVSTGVSGLGTGVATALAVNVGTAGAPVVNGGALGTPASGVATNLTGLPISTGVSGLGTGVATALAVNVGTAGAQIVDGGSAASIAFTQKLRLNNAVTSTQITADQNDYTGTDGSNTCATKKTLRMSSDAARNVTGLSCSQADGDIVVAYNAGSFGITLKDENASSTAANRFGLGADLVLSSKQGATLIYDGTAARWRQIGGPSASGGGSGTVTQVNTGPGLTGGPITTSGTISLDDAYRRNALLNCIYQSKSFTGYRRNIEQFCDGFKASDGVNSGSSSNYTVVTASGYVAPTTSAGTAISGATGTAIGDMTGGGGLAAAYNGTTAQAVAASAFKTSATLSYIGKNYSPAKRIGSVATYGSTDNGYVGSANPSVTITLFGKNGSAPANASDGTSLGSTTFTDTNNQTNDPRTITSSDTATSWDYVWVSITGNGTNSTIAAQVVFSSPGTPDNMTLVTTAQTADASVSSGRALVEYNPIDAVTLNTDLTADVSCDGGAHWSSTTLAAAGTAQAAHSIAETADTACTSGTSFAARFKTLNNKSLQLYGDTLTVH